MSDTVKLIIEIDEVTYNDIKVGKIYSSLRDVPLESAKAIANGIPLDDVKAEIAKPIQEECCYIGAAKIQADTIKWCLKILDNIGKTESEDKE